MAASHKRFNTLKPGTLFDMRYRKGEAIDEEIIVELFGQIMDTLRDGRVSPRNALTALSMCFDEIEDAFTTDVPSWSMADWDFRRSALTPDD